MSSKASLVNEKHYQVKLLLQVASQIDATDLPNAAQIKAINASAILLMDAALQLFLVEVADSCQIQGDELSIESLAAALSAEDRSHAVVETLLELESDSKSWLSELKRWHEKVMSGQVLSIKTTQKQFIALQDVDADKGLDATLRDFVDFVLTQRSYLGEW